MPLSTSIDRLPPRQALPPVAQRASQIAPFQVMQLAKRAVALKNAGHPVIQLNIGEPDFTAPPPVVEAMEACARAGRTQYTPALGITELRHAIARHYRDRWHADIDPARIVVTAGASAALNLACSALVNPGDGVLMSDPSYPCNRHFVMAAGGRPQPVPVDAGTRIQLSADLVQANWQSSTRGVLLASPANPTGTSIEPAEMRRILEVVRERSGFAIVDEIYLDLSYASHGAIAHASALSMADDVIVVNSFSKYFNMTGWRLGWMVVPEGWIDVVERLAQNLYICASALAQQAALACFEPAALAIYDARREAFRERRDWLIPALDRIGLPSPVAPDGAFYAWVDCRATGLSSDRLANHLLEESFVSVVPGHDFGQHEADHRLRLSYATALPQIKEAVERIDNWLRRHG